MSDNTKIEWADATVNAVNGCSVTSPGCTNCYAMRLAGTRMKHHPSRAGLTVDSKAGPVWNGEVRLSESQLLQPLKWKRPRKIFWNAHGDLFHDAVPAFWIARVLDVMHRTPQHTHIILTKRSVRMQTYLNLLSETHPDELRALGFAPGFSWPLPNVWLGVSVEDQTRADERIPDLLATPAAVRFLSCEPLLGPVDLAAVEWDVCGYRMFGCLVDPQETDDFRFHHTNQQGIDWVIVGGESGPNARPMENDWAESIVNQCKSAGVAVFVKQLSAGTRANHDISTFPIGLQVRDIPDAR
jgi:protein gp37